MIVKGIVLLGMIVGWLGGSTLQAQEQQSIAVTPAVFDLPLHRGQEWRSSVTVQNQSNRPLLLSATVVEYSPTTAEGEQFAVPAPDVPAETSLARWLDVPTSTITLPPHQTATVPFTISVPSAATPGDHHAAVLIGTDQSQSDVASQLRTSQLVATLFSVQVAGAVDRQGEIASFSATPRVLSDADGEFSLTFRNTGTVYVQPRGRVVLYNLWGQPRGEVSLADNLFGRVLPGEAVTRSVNWSGRSSWLQFGPYTAVAEVAFGSAATEQTQAETTVWILPITQLLVVGVATLLLLLVVYAAARSYVRLLLEEAGIDPGGRSADRSHAEPVVLTAATRDTAQTVSRLGNRSVQNGVASIDHMRKQHPWVVLLLTVLVVSAVFSGWFFLRETTPPPTSASIDASATTSEDRLYQQLQQQLPTDSRSAMSLSAPVRVVNVSGRTGTAATLSLRLRTLGIAVSDLSRDMSRTAQKTVIVYHPAVKDDAVQLSHALDGALLSALPPAQQNDDPAVVIYVGAEHIGW